MYGGGGGSEEAVRPLEGVSGGEEGGSFDMVLI